MGFIAFPRLFRQEKAASASKCQTTFPKMPVFVQNIFNKKPLPNQYF